MTLLQLAAIIFVGCTVATAGLIIRIWFDKRDCRILDERGIAARARVARVQERPWAFYGNGVAAQGTDSIVWLEFVDLTGTRHTFTQWLRLNEGDEVDLVYDPYRWSRFRIVG